LSLRNGLGTACGGSGRHCDGLDGKQSETKEVTVVMVLDESSRKKVAFYLVSAGAAGYSFLQYSKHVSQWV